MLTQADRAAERRRVKLAVLQRLDGSPSIRKMTVEGRWRGSAVPARARRK